MPLPPADRSVCLQLDSIANLAESVAAHALAVIGAADCESAHPAVARYCREAEQLGKQLEPFLGGDEGNPLGQGPYLPVLRALRRLHSAWKPLRPERTRTFKRQRKKNWTFSLEWEFEKLKGLQPGVARLKEATDNLRLVIDRLFRQPDAQQSGTTNAAGNGHAQAAKANGQPSPQGAGMRPKSRMTLDQANAKAMKLAKADRSFVHKSQRQWAKAIGCSSGLVAKLPFWLKTMKKSGRGKNGKAPGAPKAIPLTPALAATLSEGEKDQELQRLVDEQHRDARQRKVYSRL